MDEAFRSLIIATLDVLPDLGTSSAISHDARILVVLANSRILVSRRPARDGCFSFAMASIVRSIVRRPHIYKWWVFPSRVLSTIT